MTSLNHIVASVEAGDPLSDEDLDRAIDFYSDLESRVLALGQRHLLFRMDIRRTLDMLVGFRDSRRRRRGG